MELEAFDERSNGSGVSQITDRRQYEQYEVYDLLQSKNSSDDDVDGFFSVYYSTARFTSETVIATVSALVNAAVLTTLVIGGHCWTQGHQTKTVYRCLFANLAVADCLSSVSMWLGNNVACSILRGKVAA